MVETDSRDAVMPLDGVRVLEMGQLLAGPFCGQLLADFGADVVKCEPPGKGDPMREWGREKPHGQSLWWPIIARNKRSITLDLRTPSGQDLARQLVASADIVVENFRPGTLERWGMGWDELSEINPRLILIRVSGFGQTGPNANQAGYGAIGEALGGLRYVVGDPSTPPSRVGISLGDTLAGTFAALGGMMAFRERDRSGRGQVVDSAIFEAVLGVMESLIPEYAIGGYIRERSGSILPNIAPSNAYPTKDGQWLLIAGNQDTVFARLAAAMGRPELAADERYATHSARGAHQQELDEVIISWSATQELDDLRNLLNEAGVPCGQAYRAPEMLRDEHFAARESIVSVPHEQFGELPMQNVFPRLSRTPGMVRWAGPTLGEHNEEIFRGEMGLSAGEMGRLMGEGVI